MALEFVYLVIGVILGALIVYSLVSRKILTKAEEKAEEIAKRLFETQRNQLEQAIDQTYQARYEEWKTSTLKKTVEEERANALERARSVLKGKIGEQLAPLLPDFLALCNPADARFIGSPIDYLIFKNMTCEEGQDLPIEVIFLDVKTGKSGLNPVQKRIQEAVERNRVNFQMLRLEE